MNGPGAVWDHCSSASAIVKSSGGFITMLLERDVYRLIKRSSLPAIRKDGSYVMGEDAYLTTNLQSIVILSSWLQPSLEWTIGVTEDGGGDTSRDPMS